MDIAHLERPFARMGARLKQEDALSRRRFTRFAVPDFALDIREDRRGEYFSLHLPSEPALELSVTDLRPETRHLLLHVARGGHKDKLLCGHDERHWFACAVPGVGVSSVREALRALRPHAVLEAERRAGLRVRERERRHNAAFVRQGEWFFLPTPDFNPGLSVVHRDEPLSRGPGSKPHRVEELVRFGGERVYVARRGGAVLGEREYDRRLLEPHFDPRDWTSRVRDAAVFARGKVRHADHATLELRGWHRVLMNTEGEARAARNVLFLD